MKSNNYSHLNGLEFLQVHKPQLWKEIGEVIAAVDATNHKTKKSEEKTKIGKLLYSPVALNESFGVQFHQRDWSASRVDYWVTDDDRLIRKTLALPPDEQRRYIEHEGKVPLRSFNQTDFVKDRVAVEVQLGKYFAVNHDLFVKHLAFYVRDAIDVGIEIVPAKPLHAEMSTGVPWYEKALYDVVRQGRGVPTVPLVLIGVAP